ncbi:ABC-type transport system involved in multi-copper enzyme maturation permease subunit [Haloactinopolyspora alba]|uniref:ABC-type transport system involved in multi-copper enzyme maturation permease subunit n=1 Tax=Haloactinopolyspora alba TaxID=648780 RepID=A0A2P8DJ72_9ACTN|nr:ABC transporter permease subunit [Haloactinopolyspora alba]PSK97219.1 ABC-type transport system involved in multi-copper enzyme maturation permease subunit [Haloactinopolyspora alba]
MNASTTDERPAGRDERSGSGPTAVSALAAGTRAELLRLRKWPVVWVLVSVWLMLNLTFAYVFNYIAYATESGNFATEGNPRAALLEDVLPEAIPRIFTTGMPMFGGAIMMILGALAAGSGYGWGTWKTVLTQGPSRLATFGGMLAAVAGTVVAVIAITLVADLAASTLITVSESEPIVWPDLAALAEAAGSGLLIFGMWASAGVLIGVLTRSPAVAIGLGLVWSLVVENLLRSVSGLISGLNYVTDVMPGTSAGSLAGAQGAVPGAEGDGAPGVLTVLDGGSAALLLVGYIAVFTVVAAALVRRRDLV